MHQLGSILSLKKTGSIKNANLKKKKSDFLWNFWANVFLQLNVIKIMGSENWKENAQNFWTIEKI
jgi:hypothetical protein